MPGDVADGADGAPRVIFPRGSAQLPIESGAVIRAVAEALKAERSRTVLLVGYSDHWGSREISLALAVRRVDVVAKELLRQGVPGGQIRKLARGYLKSVLAQCRGPACERRLQQVELRLVDKAGRELAGLS
ncbi:OmpA family protein [Denitratisoma sp. DHT3]|uniref:OmpA family protein n=1 Tax=Denitratisoma sp. DHT3 TaxID=1981880 RepID=UPI0021BD4F91|nr:OmpA family protein [Denitratisoma sp. DHT3]